MATAVNRNANAGGLRAKARKSTTMASPCKASVIRWSSTSPAPIAGRADWSPRADVRRLTVRKLTAFDNQFDGLACYQTEHCLFTDLYLHDNPGAGISLDLAFNHNVVSNAVLVANDLGVFMRASRDNHFFDVSIRDSHHYGVFMAHAETRTTKGWGPAPQTACTDNAFTNLNATRCGGAAFRVNNVTCTNNVIISPLFAINRKGSLSLARPNLVTVQ